MKLACTALTLGAGYQGGEVTPLFGIGAALGGWFGQLAGVEPSFMAALGMIGVFGAALNVPVTTIMLSIDMFGGQAAGYFVIVAFISYLVAGIAECTRPAYRDAQAPLACHRPGNDGGDRNRAAPYAGECIRGGSFRGG